MLDNIELLKKARGGDETSKNDLITQNMPIIKSIANRYKNKGVDYEDLLQLGALGFTKAILNFDENKGVKFTTYAVPMIAGEIKRFLRDDGSIKVSRSIKSDCRQMKLFIKEYLDKTGKSPTIEVIAKHFNIDESEVSFILDSQYMPISINKRIDEDDESSSLENIIESDFSYDSFLDKITLNKLISELKAQEKRVIKLRYFLGKTQAEVASILNVSQVQVSRIENKILQNFKNSF